MDFLVDDAAKYDVPDHSKLMSGLLSGSDTFKGRDRAIGTVPSYVAGPGSRACGTCHKSMAINEDEADDLTSVCAHGQRDRQPNHDRLGPYG